MALTKMQLVRLNKDVKLWEIRRETGISEPVLSRIFSGIQEPDPEQLGKIAVALGVTPADLQD